MAENQDLPAYIELTALVYHEGRNVRELFRHNAASKHKFGALTDHLPPGDADAWQRLIDVQQRAAEAESASAAAAVFTEQYGCSTEDLAAMFESPAWKRFPKNGGPRWAAIATAVIALGELIDKKDKAAEKRATEILAMPHNTGTVQHALARLKAAPRKSS